MAVTLLMLLYVLLLLLMMTTMMMGKRWWHRWWQWRCWCCCICCCCCWWWWWWENVMTSVMAVTLLMLLYMLLMMMMIMMMMMMIMMMMMMMMMMGKRRWHRWWQRRCWCCCMCCCWWWWWWRRRGRIVSIGRSISRGERSDFIQCFGSQGIYNQRKVLKKLFDVACNLAYIIIGMKCPILFSKLCYSSIFHTVFNAKRQAIRVINRVFIWKHRKTLTQSTYFAILKPVDRRGTYICLNDLNVVNTTCTHLGSGKIYDLYVQNLKWMEIWNI